MTFLAATPTGPGNPTPDGGGADRAPGRRAAATWIAGTGAFLLLVAASLFVAVRWDQLPDAVKLAVMGAVTGAFLIGGRWLAGSFPATGDVFFHLGAFLLPLDLVAVNLHLGLGWRALLLAEGILASTVFAGLAARSGSVVLAWAGRAGVVVAAAGVAAVTPVPAAAALALAGAAAHVAGRRREAVAWSAVAGLAPVVGVAVVGLIGMVGSDLGRGVLVELGLAGEAQALAAVAVSGLAAVVLAREAAAARDLGFLALAGVSLASGGVTTWVAAGPAVEHTVLALSSLFLAAELAALLVRRDPFWAAPSRWLADAAELAAKVSVVGVVALTAAELAFLPYQATDGIRPAQPAGGWSLGLAATGFLVGALRRLPWQARPEAALVAALGHPLGALAGVTVVAAVAVGTASLEATAAALVVVAACHAVAVTASSHALAAVSALCAPLLVWPDDVLAMVLGVTGAGVVATAAVRRLSVAGPDDVFAHTLAMVAAACALEGALALAGMVPDGTALAVAVGLLWALAGVLDMHRTSLGDVVRAAMAVPVVRSLDLPAEPALVVAGATTLALAADALRLRRPVVGVGAAAALQIVVIQGCRLAGLSLAESGVGLCVAAAVWSGLAAVVPERWRLPLLAAAGAGIGVGVSLAVAEPRALANALVVSGGLVVAAGVATTRPAVGHAGGAMVVVGVLGHLAESEVGMLEAYVAPVAAQLVVLGGQARARAGASSWVAYCPSIALLGGAAFGERLAGGSAWHAVVAGAVGVAAVAVGGWRRLAGPLLLGTALLVSVSVVESLPALAGVPTWGWLATAGTLLLLVGLALERTDTSPPEVGRRLVDVIGERFE